MTDWGGIALLLLPTVPSPSSKKSNREKNTNTNANRHKYLQFQFYLVSPVYQCQRVGWSTFNNYFTHKHTNETLQNTNTWKKNRTNTLVLNLPKAEGRLGSAWSRPSATNSSSDPHRDCHRHNSAAAKCTRPASSLLHHSHWVQTLFSSPLFSTADSPPEWCGDKPEERAAARPLPTVDPPISRSPNFVFSTLLFVVFSAPHFRVFSVLFTRHFPLLLTKKSPLAA